MQNRIDTNCKIAVVLPCYKVSKQILQVLGEIGDEVDNIYVVDDCCPEKSGKLVKEECNDARVKVVFNEQNQGVGGAVIAGYVEALADGALIIVKLDGDGQMDPSLIPSFIAPIIAGEADYTKGNRFFDLEKIHVMPKARLFGNAVLSFITKLSSGYWNLFDPTNGFTAIHASVATYLPLDKISKRYFFETDMLFRLNTLRAVVSDIPMDSRYEDETSSLQIKKVITEFLFKNIRNTAKRIFYNYYLRDMSLASLEFPLGIISVLFGVLFGSYNWWISISEGTSSTAGTVMLSALPIIIGIQLILAFIGYDIRTIPTHPFQRMQTRKKK